MGERFQRLLLCAGFGIVAAWSARPAVAATFTSGTAEALTDGAGTPSNFNTLPYTTPSISTSQDASSTVTPDATGLVFKGTFSQSVSGTTGSAEGKFIINFTANAGDTYSLFGGAVPAVGIGTLNVSLFNDSTSTGVYSYSNSLIGPGTITADGTGGPTVGTFAAGNYTFTLDELLSNSGSTSFINGLQTNAAVTPGSLTGSGGITLISSAVPEPGMPTLLLIGGGALLLVQRRRRQLV